MSQQPTRRMPKAVVAAVESTYNAARAITRPEPTPVLQYQLVVDSSGKRYRARDLGAKPLRVTQ